MTMVHAITAGRAFLMGAGLVALSPKSWAFTLGAIGAIQDADLGPVAGWGVFIAWGLAAESIHLLALIAAVVAPARADVLLARAGEGLERHSPVVMIGVGLVFGAWFLLKAIAAFGFGPAPEPTAPARRQVTMASVTQHGPVGYDGGTADGDDSRFVISHSVPRHGCDSVEIDRPS